MTRTRLDEAATTALVVSYQARLDALEQEAHSRIRAGDTAGLLDWLDDHLDVARARFERELADAALPASVAECDA